MATSFTPLASAGGGVLIGISAVLLMLFFGRIAGATGNLAGVFFPKNADDWSWRVAMIAGMIAAPLCMLAVTAQMPMISVSLSTTNLILGGVIVGVGATLGSGCTSGHGVCGLARLSPRSIAAVLTFMLTTGLTVFVTRHLIGS